ncbi:transcription termination/antitermination NusG family protein [Rhizobium paknamense]|uniref:Transcriptional antiterminator NusG n=1 Tax=Rhizobium paknamense TaxID=1206817 RepID=A0ABU0ICR9_9HYPH|nr:transcription termination/antitermination NusG family protein [Rhizobium paknamense]MDQ0456031.1 transcriptional antiterminator NusG [Rhizobium paknamense]
MQLRANEIELPVSDRGQERLARLTAEQQARKRWLSMASREVADQRPDQTQWLCLRVMTGREKAVENLLEAMNIEALVPTRKGKVHYRRGRTIPAADVPVLLGYVPVRCAVTGSAMAGLKTVEHVIGVLGTWEAPLMIEADFINRYREKARFGDFDYERQGMPVRRGQRVRIAEGPFATMSGEVVTECLSGVGDVVVEVEMMGRKIPVLMPIAFLSEL